jgi:hypothetical protein
MKDLMQNTVSFLSFDFVSDANSLSQQFTTTHLFYQKDSPLWSTNATRHKLIARYWFELVLCHFFVLVGLPAILSLTTFKHFDVRYLGIVFFTGVISFSTLLGFLYWPKYYNFFLPHLETIKEVHERKQVEQLEKCKRAQLSNSALVLIYYVFDKLSGANSLQCNDRFAALLTRLYGIDSGSIKKNLELIFGNKKTVSPRKLTEIQNRFQEAYNFFEEMEFPEGVKMLHDLEQKFRTN